MTTLIIPEFEVEFDEFTYNAEIAQCEYFTLGVEDHGLFSALIGFKGASWGQGISPYSLDTYNPDTAKREGTAFGCEFIMEAVRVLGSPEKAKGVRVVVFRETNRFNDIKGFARLNDDGSFGEPFFPGKLAQKHFPS